MITANRFWLAWCVSFAALYAVWAATETDPPRALWFGAVTVLNLLLAVWYRHQILIERRRSELLRQRRVLALRGLACAYVFEDRRAPGNPRGHLASCARLSATRALDELASVRAAMGASAL